MPMALNADFFHPVTIFQPIRPLVRWSRVEKRLARRKGGSKEVDAVIPNAKFFVTAAIADIGCEAGQHTDPGYSPYTS